MWQDVIIGYNENCAGNYDKNILTTYTSVCYSIYKCWIVCNNEKQDFKYVDLFNFVKRNTKNYLTMYSSVLNMCQNENLIKILQKYILQL